MAWFILQNDITVNELQNVWDPDQKPHWIIKSDMEEDRDNFAYFPAITHNNIPVLLESVSRLDPDFKEYHKFKLDPTDFSSGTCTSKAEKIAPFERNHEVILEAKKRMTFRFHDFFFRLWLRQILRYIKTSLDKPIDPRPKCSWLNCSRESTRKRKSLRIPSKMVIRMERSVPCPEGHVGFLLIAKRFILTLLDLWTTN